MADRAVVMVHTARCDREEGGIFTRLVAGLGESGVADFADSSRPNWHHD